MPVNIAEAAGPMLLLAALAAFGARRWDRRVRLAAAFAGAVIALVPFGPLSFAALMLGLLGPVSAATLVLLAASLWASLREGGCRSSTTMLLSLVVIGAVFYPLTLGLTVFDPYEYGYRGFAVPVLMLVLVAIGWWRHALDALGWIALAGLLYATGAYDSRNLWDYLVFPLDPVFAAATLAIRALAGRVTFLRRDFASRAQ